ncbi:AAA family ATPase [Agromyces atrinae]|uniref:ATP-binding protein n=1 Tax=Agromyces atrinae TaxID=592376 RepID=A0A4Q2MA75_9MICO|nr:AAA family ATPase [Agromyces atrinae]NYD67194.1 putative ATPase [Agromyces atrinae]RXZ86971.1 ATP-binding protein [Agromyces atrinae]
MLETIAVANYRSLRSLVMPLDGLTVITGANGAGKSSLYRSLRLLASTAAGGIVAGLAREGGLGSTLWAGPENVSRAMRAGDVPVQGTRRSRPIELKLGFASDDLGYLIDLGLPTQNGPRSLFARDPEIKRELIFAGAVARPATLLVDRANAAVRVRDDAWSTLPRRIAPFESVLTEIADDDAAPEVLSVRRRVRGWRFYDNFRTDRDAPVRSPRLGTRTEVLDHSGDDLAAAVQTIIESGRRDRLDAEIDRAFPGSTVSVREDNGYFSVHLAQPGMLRDLATDELSDGTLRYLLLVAALLSPRPPELLVLNEPETSLHLDLLPRLGELIAAAAADTQVLVVSHAATLIDALTAAGGVERRLVKELGETTIDGFGVLDGPPWGWGER